MKDRVSTNPGRVLITPEDGSSPFYATMTRADNPTQEGDPLCKETFLKDDTAAKFGLGNTALPDNMFQMLAPLFQYRWKRRVNDINLTLGTAELNRVHQYYKDAASTTSIYYSDSVYVDESGALALKNPSVINVSYNTYTDANVLAGKYYKPTWLTSAMGIMFCPSGATATRSVVNQYYKVEMNTQSVTLNSYNIGDWENIGAYSNRNAYPDSGISNGYEYQYLGMFIDDLSAVQVCRIEDGTYTGTGTCGENAKNRFVFSRAVKLVAIYKDGSQDVTVYANVSGGKEFSWYGASEELQNNVNGQKYHIVGIS